MSGNIGNLDELPRASLAHTPTLIEVMLNLTRHLGTANLYIKRDDCTGLAMGGNKARQLEFYFGDALKNNADTVLITGAVQSNFTRMTAAAARKMGLECHIQVEERVPDPSPAYYNSGNILLSRVLGATLHSFPEGENEDAADHRLEELADQLKRDGKKPYVIHLSAQYPPIGALGYVVAAREIVEQASELKISFDQLIVASGSGATHAGLLFGLRALGSVIRVKGICVRRPVEDQLPRLISHCQKLSQLLGIENPVGDSDIELNDDVLAPGYGQMNDAVLSAIALTARHEGIILDPVYTGRAMAGFLDCARQSEPGRNLMFLHTGGQPAIFGYEAELKPLLAENVT